MKKIKRWAVFVGLPKWEWWKKNGREPDISHIGNVCIGKDKFLIRKFAKAEADRMDAANCAWHYIANPAWPDK
jgi:hypothetical protein